MTLTSPHGIPFEESGWVHSLHVHMLLEDFGNTVVPYRRRGEAYRLTVNGLPKDTVDDALELFRSGEGVENFVRTVASALLKEHTAWLEIFFNDPDSEGLPFRVFPATGVRQTQEGNWIRNPGIMEGPAFWAISPSDRNNDPIAVNPERLIRVQLPDKYPGEVLTKVIQGLVETDSISNQTRQREIQLLSERTSNSTLMDPSESYRTERLRVAQAALPIGWTARESYSRDSLFTEYFHYWRELQFLLFRTSMRERAEEALCRVLHIAGATCGFEASITSSGLYAPTEVEGLIKGFERGEIPLTEILNIMWEMSETFPTAQDREICNC